MIISILYSILFLLSLNLSIFSVVRFFIFFITSKSKKIEDTDFVVVKERNYSFLYLGFLFFFYFIGLFIYSYLNFVSGMYSSIILLSVSDAKWIVSIANFLSIPFFCLVVNEIFKHFYVNFKRHWFLRVMMLVSMFSLLMLFISLFVYNDFIKFISDTLNIYIFIPYILFMVFNHSHVNAQKASRYISVLYGMAIIFTLKIILSFFGFNPIVLDVIHMLVILFLGIVLNVILEKETSNITIKRIQS